jgi:hypothetical protein
MSIDVSLILNCLPKRRKLPANQMNNIIKQDDFFFQNELKIVDIVKKIPYCSIWFDIIHKHTLLKVGEMDERVFVQHEINMSREIPTYILCEYPTDQRIRFWEFMMNLPTPKRAIFHIFDSFSLVLSSIDRLNQKGLYFYGFGPDNIVFDETSLNPVLRNLENCFFADQLPQFVAKTHDYEYKPFEFHVLQYLAKKNCATLSPSILDEICPPDEYLRSFINKPIALITADLMSHSKSWDKCNLSLVYLELIEEFSVVFSLTYKFMDEFIDLLRQIADPNPTKRLSDTVEIRQRLNAIQFTDVQN